MKQQYYASSAGSESYWNGYKGRAEMKYQKWYTNRLEWLGNYALNLGDHNIKAVVGYTYEKSIWEQIVVVTTTSLLIIRNIGIWAVALI